MGLKRCSRSEKSSRKTDGIKEQINMPANNFSLIFGKNKTKNAHLKKIRE
jgi:hypothetical protein